MAADFESWASPPEHRLPEEGLAHRRLLWGGHPPGASGERKSLICPAGQGQASSPLSETAVPMQGLGHVKLKLIKLN